MFTIKNLFGKQFKLLLLPAILLSFITLKPLQAEEKLLFPEQMFQNPMYQEFTQIAKKHNLDLSFTKMAWAQKGREPQVWGPNNYKVNTIFTEKPKSIDILFIGDCTIAWGMIPKVIEQMTGKKVAFYAYASNVLTVKTTALFQKLADYYLKDDGILIYSFSNWALQKDTTFIGTSINEYNEIVNWTDEQFRQFAEQDKRKIYKEAFAQYVADKEDREKLAKQNRGIEYLRWDMDSITEYSPAFSLKSVHSEIMPKTLTRYEALQENANAAKSVFAGEKIFMIPLYSADQHYLNSRTIYYSYYQRLGFKVADMGLFLPKGDSYTMENHRHVANTGGLKMSILIGEWFKKYLSDKSIGKGKTIDFSFLKHYKNKLDYLIVHTPENSTIYLPASWVDKKIISYMKERKRNVITQPGNKKQSFYYLSDTLDEGKIKNYTFKPVYADTLGSMLLRFPDALIILSIMDDGSYSLSDTTKQYFRDHGIDIDKLKFAGSLVALIDKDKTIAWDIQNKAPTSLDPKLLSKYGIQKVLSAGSHWGNTSEIIISNENYSKQHRGFNYVIRKKDGNIINGFVDTYERDETGEGVKKAVFKG